LSADLPVLSRKGDESQVHGIQHDFYRQQQRNDVPLQKKPENTNQEKNCTENQVPADRNHRSFFANTTAPIKAISINNEVTSNGSRKSVNRLSPIA
jgi:hypothetical protein